MVKIEASGKELGHLDLAKVLPSWEDEKKDLAELVATIKLGVENGNNETLKGLRALHTYLTKTLQSLGASSDFSNFTTQMITLLDRSLFRASLCSARPAIIKHIRGSEVLAYDDKKAEGVVSPRDIRLLNAAYGLDGKPVMPQGTIVELGITSIPEAILKAKTGVSTALRYRPFPSVK